MTSIKLLACLCTLLALLGAGCSSSSTPSSSTSGSSGGSGSTQKITGIPVPQHVAVVTATNAG